MKLSLAWIFDHIDADWRKIDVPALVNLFNKTTAEIEGFQKFSLDLKKLAAAKITDIKGQTITASVPEWKKTITLPARDGAAVDQIYLVAHADKEFAWAKLSDLGSQKDGLFPVLMMNQKELEGGWKKTIGAEDYIIHLDNKSINHRPDMWGHRGVAREIAALLNLPFKALDGMLVQHAIKEYQQKASANKEHSFSIVIENPDACKRFAGLYFSSITAHPCIPWMAVQLTKVDSRPINAIVDATNYVMLDISQPMHVFDAQKLANKSIVVRNAKNKEQIALLDGQTIELSSDDCVVTDGKKPIALAGIMGGKDTAIDLSTKQILLESANFDPAVIRKAAARVKKRTESSARFEKSLDPYQNTIAIERFLKLLDDAHIAYVADEQIVSLQTKQLQAESKALDVAHSFIEELLGVTLTPEFVIKTLTKLEFGVDAKNGIYHIVIPSFRATKDIAIKQDIVEEIGRFYGYDTIGEQLPSRQTKPFDLTAVMRIRRIKQLLAYAFDMQELYTYAFFDESFLSSIGWEPGPTLKVQEAVSQNWQRLVTTLIPNLCKAVQVHSSEYDRMNFFEWAHVWPHGFDIIASQSLTMNANVEEKSNVSGIFFDQKNAIDFYEVKQKFCRLAQLLGLHFDWITADPKELAPWYLPYQTAYVMCEGQKIAVAGKANPAFFAKISPGDAFIFEFDGDFLLSVHVPTKRYTPASKYPHIVRDVSMLVPLAVTVKQLRTGLAKLDPKIMNVALVDFFEKPEWKDQKSLTFRITLIDPQATMTTAQADNTMKTVTNYLEKQGATIR